MQILDESFAPKAWCIDRKGRVITVRVHPFGALDDDAVEDACWLRCVDTEFPEDLLVKYIANQILYDYGEDVDAAEVLNIIESCKNMPELSGIIQSVNSYIKSHDNGPDMSEETTEKLGDKIKNYLNTNYLRARYGSEYQNRVDSRGAIYFRTSSTDGFNWYNVIVKFLAELPPSMKVKEITVERDLQATGISKIYIDRMPIEEFLMHKPMVIESVKRCGGEL